MASQFFLMPKLVAIMEKFMDIYISKVDNNYPAIASLDKGYRFEIVQ